MKIKIHESGQAHGAVSPSCIVVNRTGLDLLPSIGNAGGITPYTPPEVIHGKAADSRSDVFAFGLIFFELMSGLRALPEGSLDKLLDSLRNPQFPHRLAAELPQQFHETLISMLATDPRSRPTADNVQMMFRE